MTDCNSNGILDECELTSETDCNENGVPDVCELTSETDCNANGVLDVCELTADTDCNANGVLDECELTSETDCNGNTVLDGCELTGTAELIENGGFETGDFSGWTTINFTARRLGGQQRVAAALLRICLPGVRRPLPGGLGPDGPGQPRLYQDVSIPANAPSATLAWTHRITTYGRRLLPAGSANVAVPGRDPADTDPVLQRAGVGHFQRAAGDAVHDAGWRQPG